MKKKINKFEKKITNVHDFSKKKPCPKILKKKIKNYRKIWKKNNFFKKIFQIKVQKYIFENNFRSKSCTISFIFSNQCRYAIFPNRTTPGSTGNGGFFSIKSFKFCKISIIFWTFSEIENSVSMVVFTSEALVLLIYWYSWYEFLDFGREFLFRNRISGFPTKLYQRMVARWPEKFSHNHRRRYLLRWSFKIKRHSRNFCRERVRNFSKKKIPKNCQKPLKNYGRFLVHFPQAIFAQKYRPSCTFKNCAITPLEGAKLLYKIPAVGYKKYLTYGAYFGV